MRTIDTYEQTAGPEFPGPAHHPREDLAFNKATPFTRNYILTQDGYLLIPNGEHMLLLDTGAPTSFGKGLAGVAMFEHVTNPGYPSYPNPDGLDRIPEKYPRWRCVLPCFPGSREVPLPKGEPLVLKHRLWIHPGEADEATVAYVWTAHAQPPKVGFDE